MLNPTAPRDEDNPSVEAAIMLYRIRQATTRGTLVLLALTSLTLGACSDEVTDPSSPTTLTITSGDQQTTTALAALAAPFVVTVADQYGAAMPGVTVTWEIVSGGGSLSVASSVSDVDGKAQATYTAGTTAGTGTVTAVVSGLSSVTFTATITAAP